MRRALDLARRGWARVSPNPMVGAVVVREGQIVGEGWHREYGAPHAEVEALRDAGELTQGATLYVTLEPCSHRGKTGPCTAAILSAGISRVVFACEDPDPLARGGAAQLRDAGLEVISGIEARPARILNQAFFRSRAIAAPARPFTDLKLALSLDGKVADLERRSVWITGKEARTEVHRLRAGYDAIAVGIGTALADDPLLTVRGEIEPRKPPIRIIFDRALRLPLRSHLVTSAREVPLWILCAPEAPEASRRALEAEGATILQAVDLRTGLEKLFQAGIASLFCEGGARVAGALLEENLIDRLSLFYAPIFLGRKGIAPFESLESQPLDLVRRWQTIRSERFGSDTLICIEPPESD